MARFFVDRPVFAIVIGIVIVILGLVAIPNLPIATYPEVVPPVVQIVTSYRGGSALDIEKTVAQPIEQQLTGVDGMLYFFSRSSNNGVLTIDVTFELGTDVDLAVVKTQNKVNVALPSLPPDVQRVGVTVKKVSSAFLLAIGMQATDNRYDSLFVGNYATINVLDRIGSIPGVGDVRLAATQDYGMRVWIDPDKMAKLGLTATDVNFAIQEQNRQNPAGALGQPPAPSGTAFQYPVTATGRLTSPEEFSDLVLRAEPGGSFLRLRDIARVDLGAQDYSSFSRLTKKPAAIIIVYLAPGANAVDTASRVFGYLSEAKKNFPQGIDYTVGYDATKFVRAAIIDVVETLVIAILLVIFVVFVFLQNWRATLIPLVTVPVAIIGTFALFPLLGFSINMTSMFGLVLAIGIVVDDAIVVVEAVQHKIDQGMTSRDATIQAMREVSGPVVAIALILSAVFIPVSLLGGISGQIYRQFALTIVTSVLISAFSALSLSPALSAMILRPNKESGGISGRFFSFFNRGFDWTTRRYLAGAGAFIRKSVFSLAALALCFIAVGGLFKTLPAGFLPDEDQGVILVQVRLPDGASLERNQKVTAEVEEILLSIPGVEAANTLGGFDITTSTNSSNVSTVIAVLTPWDQRKTADLKFDSILGQINARVSSVREAVAFGFGLPPIIGLGTAGGFEFMVEDRTGGEVGSLSDVSNSLLSETPKQPALGFVANTFRVSVPSYKVEVDKEKVQSLGIPLTDVYNALQTFLGGLYVNDFNRFGRTWRVIMQAEAEFRRNPDAVNRFYVRSSGGDMVPLSTLVKMNPVTEPDVIYRYNRYRAAKLIGQTNPGFSAGQSAAAMEEVARKNLPAGFGFEWTGTVFQQKLTEGKEGIIFGFAAVLVFLFLAAQYESWAIPFAVVLVVPLGMMGALIGVLLRSYPYDVYTQIGIVTLIGLASKNAILIVEFARQRRENGASIVDAALEAAHLRLRPIIMTSLAFILGVSPLLLANGAGAGARRALGTAVFSGMISATLLAIFFVPMLYVVTQRIAERLRAASRVPAATTLGLVLILLLSSCTMGPNYKRPAVGTPPAFRGTDEEAGLTSLAESAWPDLFKDPVLTDLVSTALRDNFDARIAAERVLQARSQFGIVRSEQFPSLDLNATFAANRSSSIGANNLIPPGSNTDVSYSQAGFNLGWELDVWGRIRRLKESALAQYLASEEAQRGVTVTLIADISSEYLALRELDLQLEIARNNLAIAQDSLDITSLREQRGVASGLDVQQSEQLRLSAKAQITASERAIAQSENALSLLLGKSPADIPRGKKLEEMIPPAQVPSGLPSALLGRRPDIRGAEQSLIAANAQIGVARAEYFPQISLTGFMGGQSQALSELLIGPARLWSANLITSLPLFNAGRIRAGVELSESEQREAVLQYQKTIQGAFREVSDALIAYRKNTEQLKQQEDLVNTLREASRLSMLRYEGGLDSYLQVLVAQRALFLGELTQAELRRDTLLSVVELYRSLGGGWQ
jgi:hydrophobe/amphiphile efflux-1 (HAE1) family protein/NodT family efflux transporter outer membrane factor (OMF) lipoprotein